MEKKYFLKVMFEFAEDLCASVAFFETQIETENVENHTFSGRKGGFWDLNKLGISRCTNNSSIF